MSRKRLRNPDPSIRRDQLRFGELDSSSQRFLAAWAVILKSFPPAEGERVSYPDDEYGRAVGEISLTVGLRSRKKMNYRDVYRGRGFRPPFKALG